MTLKRSTDRKTANKATPNGKTPSIANAFGLLSGTQFSCPGATSVCDGVCYAGKLERIFKGMRNVMQENYDTVMSVNGRVLVGMLNELLDTFEQECERKGAEKLFRIHHDGDFVNLRYTNAWSNVMLAHPNVQFWAYTRSFHLVPALSDVPNLTLYLSVDSDNLDLAIETHAANPWVMLAALGKTFDDARTLLQAFGRKGVRCPELNGALTLIDKNGGACVRCGLCIYGRNDVLFSSSKK